MKISNIFNPLIILLLSVFSLSACEANSSNSIESGETKSAVSDQANPILTAYLQLKDDLVETNAKKAQKSAEKFVSTLQNATGDNIETIRSAANTIAKSTNVEEQRVAFETLSDAFYLYAQKEDMGVKIYRQYCPMAFDDKGAYWLSTEKKIMNPYFGDRMLHCGVVKEEF